MNSEKLVKSVDVLHISEAYGGGVQSAILRYVANSPDLEHEMLVRARSEHDISESCSVHITSFTGSMPGFLREARAHIIRTRPHAIHLHSSFAGLLRFFDFGHDVKIIYTPHAYAFLRRDSGVVARSVYRGVESVLSRRPQVIAAISPYEAASASRMAGPLTKVTYLPNVVATDLASRAAEPKPPLRPEVLMVGRISAQKDPHFFANVAMACHADIRWTWVGDGDPAMRADLEHAGVTVTGWLPNDLVKKHVAAADLYFHSASWEGAPITLLEAAAAGTPILARGIATLEGLGFPLTEDCPRAAAVAVEHFFSDFAYRVGARTSTTESVEVHSSRAQTDALGSLYRHAR